MAQAGDYDQSQDDSSLNEETGGKTSLFEKLKNKTKDHGKKLKTKLHERQNKSDDASDYAEETTSPLDRTAEDDSGVTEPDSGVPESDDKEPSKPTGENFPGDFTGIADDQTPTEASAEESGLAKDFEGLSTNEKSESDEQTPPPAESGSAEELESSKPETESTAADKTTEKSFGTAGEQKYASPDAPMAAAPTESEQLGDKATEAGKTWSQWAAEKVGYAKETAAAKAPTTEDGTPIQEKAYHTAAGAKDSAMDTATGAKDSIASQIPDQSSIPSDPAQQTYFQKATGGFYGAKDSLFSSTQPGEHDKALSQKVTESVGNLPASIRSSLGFGQSAASPTTTPGIGQDAPVESTSEEAAAAPPQSPGLVSRITGLFGSKKAATEESSPTSEPTISEGGSETATEVSEEGKME